MLTHLIAIAVTGGLIVTGAILSGELPPSGVVAIGALACAWLLFEWRLWPRTPCPRCGSPPRTFGARRARRRRFYRCGACACKMDWQGNDTGDSYLTSREWRSLPRPLQSHIVLAYIAGIAIALALALGFLVLKGALRSLFRL